MHRTTRWLRAVALVLMAGAWLAGWSQGAEATTPAVTGGQKNVFVLPLKGVIDKSLLFVFRRAFHQVEALHPAAVVIELDTPGGGIQETEEIIAWMRSVKVPIYAFVNPHATSAGAIISLASTAIFMAPGSNIGSAMPIAISPLGGGVQELPPDVKEKMLSYVRSLVRGLAQENDHSVDVAVAMVDPSKGLKVGDRVVCREGELLNLTALEAIEVIPPATKPLLATAMVDNLTALLEHVGLPNATITRFEEKPVERLARYITMIGPLLLGLGVLALYIEFKTPGFGLPGISGIVLLAIYFFGHYIAGLAGLEDIVLVLVGFILLAVEVFLIPGFGAVGVIGLICIVAGVLMGMIPHLPKVLPLPGLPNNPTETLAQSNLQDALRQFAAAGLVVLLGVLALRRFLPKTTMYRRLVLQKTLSQDDGFVASNVVRYAQFLGAEGVAASPLRPAGIAMFGAERLDVVSSGDMIGRNAKVRVIAVEGSRVVVEEIKPTPPTASA